MSDSQSEQPKPRSPVVTGLSTLLILGFVVLVASQVLDALLTGRTRFPVRWNDTYVTWDANRAWYVASLMAWLLMTAVMAYAFLRCWKQFVQLLRR